MPFRSMNAWAAAQTGSPCFTIKHTEDLQAPSLTSIQPSVPWEQNAIAHFLDNFTAPAWHGGPGYLESLPDLLKSPSDCLHEALLAVSLASLGNISCIRRLQTDSKIHYGRALRTLSAALGPSLPAARDDILATIVLLQKYEVCVANTIICMFNPNSQ